jgi:hypothetical protein
MLNLLNHRQQKTRRPATTRLRGWPGLALDQLEDRVTPAVAVDNVLVHGTSLLLDNGGLFTHFLSGGGGAGADKFLTVRNTGTEQGYNTNATPLDLDTKAPTRAILLG